jgi:Flp pilus assembly protein TadG
MRLRRQHDNGQRGATLIEFAIVVPLLLLLLFGIVEVSRLVAEFTSIRTAAREGARFATTTDVSGGVPHYRDCSGIIEAAQAKSVLGATGNISVTWTSPATPAYIHTCTSADTSNDPDQKEVVSGTIVLVEVISTFETVIPLLAPFFDGIELDTEQSREIFVGQTT